MEKETIVLYPSLGMGHIISMVEFGKLILSHDNQTSFSIIILILTPPHSTGSTAEYISAVSSTIPSISFHHLPTTPIPPSLSPQQLFEDVAYELPRLNNSNIHQALKALSQTSFIKALVFDFFNDSAIEVASNLNIPAYYFFTSSASALAGFLYLPTLHKTITTDLKDLNETLHIPGLPPIPSSDMPVPQLVRDTNVYRNLLSTGARFARATGIIVNSFKELETRAFKALSDGECVPDGPTPPIFAIGPLISTSNITGQKRDGHENECLSWLNSQPTKSVVFLCFGSMGLFSGKQLKEMAIGLERSGHRFLWVVRSPPREDDKRTQMIVAPPGPPNLDELLPEGFLERTKHRGMVVKSWAPQVAVLSHDSVGGFVSHCGWNSVLEAVCTGVPMAAWPLYAEQKMNRIILVEDIKVALAINQSQDGFVSGAELEERVKELMDPERGKAIRERALALRDGAVAALKVGGSRLVALAELTQLWRE